MLNEDYIYQQGLNYLQSNPPDLIKALDLIKKAKDIYESKGKIREVKSTIEKLNFICENIEKEYFNQSKENLRIFNFKNAIKNIQKAKKYHLLLLSIKNELKITYDSSIRKYNELLEEIIINYLSSIQKKVSSSEFKEEYLSELYFIIKTLSKELFLNQTDDEEIPNSFFNELKKRKKLYKTFVKTTEILAIYSKNKAIEYIDANDINLAIKYLNISKNLYKNNDQIDFKNSINSLMPFYNKIYELKGDLEFNKAIQLKEAGRLKKSIEHYKNSFNYYKISNNEKKIKLSENNYIETAINFAKKFLDIANEAEKFGDNIEAIQKLMEAKRVFEEINDINFIQKIENEINRLYKKIGDVEYLKYEKISFEEFKKEKFDRSSDLSIPLNIYKDIAPEIEFESYKIQLLRDALFYYEKSKNNMLVNRIKEKIENHLSNIANKLYKEAKKQLKLKNYENSYILYKKSIFYYKSAIKDKFVNEIQQELEKNFRNFDQNVLNNIEKKILQIEINKTNNDSETNKLEGEFKSDSENIVKESIKKDNYLCSKCNKIVPPHYYDAIQEKCLDCREKIKCDECGNEIQPNEIFMECSNCKNKFDLNCADLIYDFIQKKCVKCRKPQICKVCNKTSEINQAFNTCSICGNDFCSSHFDIDKNLCLNCRGVIKCSICNKELNEMEEIFICNICNKKFCISHFDINRQVCLDDRKEEICANCGLRIEIEKPAFKCKICKFIYCKDHFVENYGICSNCYQSSPTSLIIQPNIKEFSLEKKESFEQLFNILRKIIEKYNQGIILDSDEIKLIVKNSINLPNDEFYYINFGKSDDYMVIINDEYGKPYVILTPKKSLIEDSKYFGDLIRKFRKYIPDIEDDLDSSVLIRNLICYAKNHSNWSKIYYFLNKTILKPIVESINTLKLVLNSASYLEIKESISQSIFNDIFSNKNLEEILNYIKSLKSEDDIEFIQENNEKLEIMLKVFFRLNQEEIIGASEILSFLEL